MRYNLRGGRADCAGERRRRRCGRRRRRRRRLRADIAPPVLARAPTTWATARLAPATCSSDQNGKLLGDHICRQGGVGGKVQHGIYVGDADDRRDLLQGAPRAGRQGRVVKLGFGSFDEFAGVEAAGGCTKWTMASMIRRRWCWQRRAWAGRSPRRRRGWRLPPGADGRGAPQPPAQKTFTTASIAEVSASGLRRCSRAL